MGFDIHPSREDGRCWIVKLKVGARPFNHYRKSLIDGWVVFGIMHVVIRL
jgi:hypothetical protein